jgi:hypothetical protein
MSFADLLEPVDRVVMRVLGEKAEDEVIVYTPGVGVAVPVDGVFDAAYTRENVGEAGASTAEPAVFLLLADLPSNPRTDSPTLTIRGVAYSVREVEPDGDGGVRLFLQEA